MKKIAAALGVALAAAALASMLRPAGLPSRPAAGPDFRPTPYPEIGPRCYVAPRATAAPRIDGRLDDPAWAAAPWSDDFVDIEGDAKPRPRFRTRMKMTWDEDYLYIAAELEEPHVWGTLTKHDEVIFQDNDFEVFVDPDGDGHVYAELEVNALNTTWDLLLTKAYKDGGRAINGWDVVGLKTAVAVDGTLNDARDTDRGWTLEMAWPMASLKELTAARVPPAPGDQWKINFSRVEWRHEVRQGRYEKLKGPEDNWVWSPQGVIDMHRPERWGVLQFGETGREEALPYADQAARHRLYRVYYAQQEFRKARGRWARTTRELGLEAEGVRLETTGSWFEASLGRVRVSRDGRSWRE